MRHRVSIGKHRDLFSRMQRRRHLLPVFQQPPRLQARDTSRRPHRVSQVPHHMTHTMLLEHMSTLRAFLEQPAHGQPRKPSKLSEQLINDRRLLKDTLHPHLKPDLRTCKNIQETTRIIKPIKRTHYLAYLRDNLPSMSHVNTEFSDAIADCRTLDD